jgi:hypothetical protein
MTLSVHPFDLADGTYSTNNERLLALSKACPDLEPLMAMGKVDNVRRVEKFGKNLSTDDNKQDIWDAGGLISHLTVSTEVEVLSDSEDDADEGTGAQTVFIEGIRDVGGVWTYSSEILTMNGTTPVATTTKWFRLYRAIVATRGDYDGSNAGTITVRVISGGATQCQIPVDPVFNGDGSSQNSHFTTAHNEHALIYYIIYNRDSAKTADINLRVRVLANSVATPFAGLCANVITHRDIPVAGYWDLSKLPLYFGPHSDIWFQAVTSAAQGGSLSVNYSMMVITEKS